MVLERKGPMTIASRNCQNHVQRLQGRGTIAPLPSGSQGLDPRTLRPERLEWLSIPSPAKSRRRKSPVRVRERWMGLTDPAKSEPAAKIVAFPNTCGASVSRRKATAVCLQTAIALPGGPPLARKLRRASAHNISIHFFRPVRADATAGTDPSTFSHRAVMPP